MTQVRSNPNFASDSSDWSDLLRTNCLILTASQHVTNSVSLSRGFQHGMERERDLFVDLAQRLAEEYGLLSKVESHGYYVTIRFSRPEPEVVVDATGSEPVLNKAGAWLKARFGRAAGSEVQP